MKYLGILFALLAFNTFAQKEIFLQSDPDGRYVVTYTTNSYVMLFDYQDVLDAVKDPELKNAIKVYLDTKLSKQETVELNKNGQTIIVEDEDIDLKYYGEWRILGTLLQSGNVIIMDPYGKPTVSSIIRNREFVDKKGYITSYSDATTGDKIYVGKKGFIVTGCPSF